VLNKFCFFLSGKDGKDKGGSASSSDSEDSKEDNKSSLMERKLTNMRRNIREVMSENQLDEETLAAQRQEMERLRRVQEQQRIIREVIQSYLLSYTVS
jgi:RAD54-like protein 2